MPLPLVLFSATPRTMRARHASPRANNGRSGNLHTDGSEASKVDDSHPRDVIVGRSTELHEHPKHIRCALVLLCRGLNLVSSMHSRREYAENAASQAHAAFRPRLVLRDCFLFMSCVCSRTRPILLVTCR
jgi:hypothetical protein